MKGLNPHKRRAMEEEDGNRYHPVNPFNSPDMIDEDIPEIEGPPDEQFTIDKEHAIK